MSSDRFRQVGAGLFRFVVFLLAYYTPYLIEATQLSVVEDSLRTAVLDALEIPEVRIELLRNVFAHLLVLVACYALARWIALRIAAATGISSRIASTSVFLVLWVLLVAGNRVLYPLSDYSTMFEAIAKPVIAAAASAVFALALAFATLHWIRSRGHVIAAVALFLVGGFLIFATTEHSTVVAAPGGRNIILVGIDSLSPHLLESAGGVLPNLVELSKSGTSFERAYTPIGRTFPAWVSLLSGLPPAEHGAVFNLRAMDRIQRHSLVTHALRADGYRTLYAIDERRFSNLDESFGFDRVVGPKPGALDFLLQRFNDTPLTNLLLQAKVGGLLLPFSRFNAASHANYDSDGFVEAILASAVRAERLFLAVHFESGHFPFKVRHATREFEHPNRMVSRHVSALTVADTQVGKLLDGLRRSGHLDDALVVLLSDHGESLGEIEASTTRGGERFDVQASGHGGDLLSEHQNRIVLGLVRFRNGLPVGESGIRTEQVSITDLRAAIEGFAGSGQVKLEAADECMTVETGIRFAAIAKYASFDERAVVRESASYYEIDEDGRLQLREDRLRELVSGKDVGWRCRDRLTIYSRALDRYFAYRITDGEQMSEASPLPADIARIERYRGRLRLLVGG